MLPPLTIPFGDHSIRLLPIEGGPFRMGSDPISEPERWEDEGPLRDITLADFYLAEYPVTQALWTAVMKPQALPFHFNGENRPVETVSWEDAQTFLEKLLEFTDLPLRLPTEAEWEYAARGGRFGLGAKYAGSSRLTEVGWFETNSHGETKPANRKYRNELGLYDMTGNVLEWCADDWHSTYNDIPADGSAWVNTPRGTERVFRGGSWANTPLLCRTAFRDNWRLDDAINRLGFRLALSAGSVGSR